MYIELMCASAIDSPLAACATMEHHMLALYHNHNIKNRYNIGFGQKGAEL